MSNLPIRDVGNVGVITDISPENLPLNAFSRAKNVRFDENKVTRSPVFRNIKDSMAFPRLPLVISMPLSWLLILTTCGNILMA